VTRARPERLLAIVLVLLVTGVIVVAVAALFGEGLRARPDPTDAPSGQLTEARVIRVVDGDTVVVAIGGREERLRYVGVDAPELADPESGTPAECGGLEATEANRAIVLGRTLALESDVSDRDRFGRLLRHPWITVGGEPTLVTEILVRDGAVEARSYPPDTRHDARLEVAERLARRQDAGIWGGC